MSFFLLSASSICPSYGLSFFFFFISGPSYRTPIIDLRVVLFFFPRFFLGAVPTFVFFVPPFSFSLSPLPVRTISLTSHIRIVISPVVGVGAPATTVRQPWYKRVISGRKKYVMECAIVGVATNTVDMTLDRGQQLFWINFGGLGTKKVQREQGRDGGFRPAGLLVDNERGLPSSSPTSPSSSCCVRRLRTGERSVTRIIEMN